MWQWLVSNIIGVVGILVGGFIAYHVFFLSRKLTLRDHLAHKDIIQKKVSIILNKIYKGENSDVELINVKRYLADYPHNNKETRKGYTYVRAELKSLAFDGIELFCGVRELYQLSDGGLTLTPQADSIKLAYNALEVGTIPYEWIDYIDAEGDEFSYRPQFFTKFKGMKKYPYKRLSYFIENESYRPQNDFWGYQWKRIEIKN